MPHPEPLTLTHLGVTEIIVPLAPARSSRLTFSAETVTWGVHRVDLASAVDLRYVTRFESTAMWQQRLVRRVLLQGPDASIDIALGLEAVDPAAGATQVEAYLALVDHLHHLLEPRLRLDVVNRLRRGATVECGRLSLSTDGLLLPIAGRRSRTLVAWERLPSAHFERDTVQIFADSPTGSVLVAELSMLAPLAVLLPELLEEAITALT